MKQCPGCNNSCNDEDMVCPNCGYLFEPTGFKNLNPDGSSKNSAPLKDNGQQNNFNPQDNMPPHDNYNPQDNMPPRDNYNPQGNMPPRDNYNPQDNMPPRDNFNPQGNMPPRDNFNPQGNMPPHDNFNMGGMPPQSGWQNPYSQNNGFEPKNNGMAVASLVLGIVGLVTFWCYGFGLIPGILALVFGIISKKHIKASNGAEKGDGLALSGIILSIFALILSLLALAFFIYVFTNPNLYKDFLGEYLQDYGRYQNGIK